MGNIPTNIPTDLLRTLVTVVDERSFTRAAQILGVTQPAVSAQIKRLHGYLGNDLFDRADHGIRLTPKGDLVVSYARRLLSINDVILHLSEPKPSPLTIRLGMPEDFVGGQFTGLLADFRKRWPDLRFTIQQGNLEQLVRDMAKGQLDIALGPSMNASSDARHCWTEEAVWLRGRGTSIDPDAPVPLVAFREDWICHRLAVNALSRVGRASDLVFTAPTISSLAAAVGAGMGTMVLSRCRVRLPDMMIWEDPPLPKLPDLNWGLYVREGAEHGLLDEIADATAALVISRVTAAAAGREAAQPVKPIAARKREAS